MHHFKIEEFNCPCCGENKMDEGFLNRIDVARSYSGIPFVINSGYRCQLHNREVGSTSDNHTKGLAADIKCTNSQDRFLIVQALINAGFSRIGVYETYIHVDSNYKPYSLWL